MSMAKKKKPWVPCKTQAYNLSNTVRLLHLITCTVHVLTDKLMMIGIAFILGSCWRFVKDSWQPELGLTLVLYATKSQSQVVYPRKRIRKGTHRPFKILLYTGILIITLSLQTIIQQRERLYLTIWRSNKLTQIKVHLWFPIKYEVCININELHRMTSSFLLVQLSRCTK